MWDSVSLFPYYFQKQKFSCPCGQLVKTLVDGEEQAGCHEGKFEGSNLASEVYFCRLQAGSYMKTMKMLILR